MMNTTMQEAEAVQQDTDDLTLEDMTPENFIAFVTEGGNLVEYMSEADLTELSQDVEERYKIDEETMSDWRNTMKKGLDFAKMTKGDKTYPHSKASNIKYPLISQAALQYNARAYPAIVPSGDPVQSQVHGEDPNGLKAQRGDRVADYSSYQLKVLNKRWETDTDRMTFIGPIVGTMFRKYWYDPATQSQKSKVCTPGSVVINNHISDISEMPAVTEEFDLYLWEIESRRRTGWYVKEEIEGESELDKNKPQEFIEQIRRIDLDGDGYEEPYVVTMHKDSRKIFRVSAAFDLDDVRISEDGETILSIEATTFYIDFPFLPSVDGGFMGLGLGALLGDTSESINSILNMLMDSAHYEMMGGGFIGSKDFRVKGAQARFEPGEWKHVNFHGGDIRNGVVPMQYPSPSPVMFQLLGLMIDAGRELSSTSNIMTGDSANANMPVGTVMALIEQGMQVFTASYKRIYRSLTKEYELLCKMNARYLSAETYSKFFDMTDEEGQPVLLDPSEEFDLSDMDITPVADPKSVTDIQKMARAQMILEMAKDGLVDQAEAVTRVLRAASIEDVESLIPQANPMQQQMEQMQIMALTLDMKMKAVEIENKIADTQSKLAKAAKDVASAESEELGRNLTSYLQELNAMKQELELGQQRLAGMAGSPGNGLPINANAQNTGAPQGGLPRGPLG